MSSGTCGFHDESPLACNLGDYCTMTELSSTGYIGCCSADDGCLVYTACTGQANRGGDPHSGVLTCPDIPSSSRCQTLIWPELTATSFACGATETVRTVDLNITTSASPTGNGDDGLPTPTEPGIGDEDDEPKSAPGMGGLSTAARIGIGVGSSLIGAILVASAGVACYKRCAQRPVRRRGAVTYKSVNVKDKH